ncbi:helix-turn-helix domain-containing protein [Lachnospira multipara]|uniref:helix-turn-helix domain-containing protein n=1 Tax=Lachnospira multipara TaxID=28051 RepID=UPI0005520365|nr:helix-turn-helix transcriptional regulator [Lachnospira multipara]
MNQQIGKRIKQLRTEKELSREDLAFKIGISTAQLYRIETKGANFSIDTLMELCNYFNVDSNYILNGIITDYFIKNKIKDIIDDWI